MGAGLAIAAVAIALLPEEIGAAVLVGGADLAEGAAPALIEAGSEAVGAVEDGAKELVGAVSSRF